MEQGWYQKYLGTLKKKQYDKAKEIVFEGARAEDAECLAMLGLFYWERIIPQMIEPFTGIDGPLRIAASKGNERASAWLGWISKDIGMYREPSNYGIEGLYENDYYAKGYCYSHGVGTRISHKDAVIFFKKAAEQGDMLAQYELYHYYRYGLGICHNNSEAIKWLRLSAEQGYYKAQHSLGEKYEHGFGVEKDINNAMYWYKQASLQGYNDIHTVAGYNHLYSQGHRLKWSARNHICFPEEFKRAQFVFLLCLKRNEIFLPRDMRMMIISLISEKWEETVSEHIESPQKRIKTE